MMIFQEFLLSYMKLQPWKYNPKNTTLKMYQ